MFKRRAAFFFFILALSARASNADCDRQYALPHEAGGVAVQQIRLVHGEWEIGFGDLFHPWKPLGCDPALDTDFLDGTNNAALGIEGEAHVGRSASFVFFPSQDVPAGVKFDIRAGDLFGSERRTVVLPRLGRAFLDRRVYAESRVKISGIPTRVIAEPGSPAKAAAERVIGAMARLLPHAAAPIARKGGVTVVLARNTTEDFKPGEIILPNGIHDGRYRYAVLFSQDGVGTFAYSVLEHSFHEIGSLFQIPDPYYAKGLSWMVAYDQMLKQAATDEERKAYRCLDLGRVIGNIQDTIASENGDQSGTIELYVDAQGARGWPMYAWGSAFYWEETNLALEAAGSPDLYAVLDGILENGLPGSSSSAHDLDRLLAAYPPGGSGTALFGELVSRYFRGETLGQLLSEAKGERAQLRCAP